MSFVQAAPCLANQFTDDSFLQRYLERVLPANDLHEIRGDLNELGEIVAGELYRLQLEERLDEPRLTQWSAWGERVDRIKLTRVWRTVAPLAARYGLIARPYAQSGAIARAQQFALVYLFTPASDMYSCPLAMTDGAARTLLRSGNAQLIERAVPRLTSLDPRSAWTSGQWMTELTGGSDVSNTLTIARYEHGQWRLYGKKWFTSAITADMALTLARPEGNPDGAKGLALFYVETRDEQGRPNGMRVERLKDKLGTRKLPTAELQLDGAVAVPVKGLDGGTRNIEPMLAITRTWNSVSAVSLMRRGLALARAYARSRRAFGAALIDHPLHADTLAGLEAEFRGAFLLTFELVQLLGHAEAGGLDGAGQALLRVLTPMTKLLSAKQSVAVLSEVLECFGGAGYVEDTGIPVLLRDAQVLPIWEGTTNVLTLDALLRGDFELGLPAIEERVQRIGHTLAAAELLALMKPAQEWLRQGSSLFRDSGSRARLEANGRRCIMTVGRALELALLLEHAQWQLAAHGDRSGIAAARYFALAAPASGASEMDDAHPLL